MMIQIIAAVIATVGFSVLFGVPSKYYPYCGVIGGAGWLVYLLTLEHFRTAGASLAATMVVIFLSRLAAVRKKCPVTIFLIAGIFPLVPGAGVYWTAYYIVTAVAGGRDRLHGSEGGGGYRAGNCVYI